MKKYQLFTNIVLLFSFYQASSQAVNSEAIKPKYAYWGSVGYYLPTGYSLGFQFAYNYNSNMSFGVEGVFAHFNNAIYTLRDPYLKRPESLDIDAWKTTRINPYNRIGILAKATYNTGYTYASPFGPTCFHISGGIGIGRTSSNYLVTFENYNLWGNYLYTHSIIPGVKYAAIFDISAGARVKIAKDIAIFGEAGFGLSLLKVGLIFEK